VSIRELFKKEPESIRADATITTRPDANERRERLLALAKIGRRQHPK
jgi:hypothetical protein